MKDVQQMRIGGWKRTAWFRHAVAGLALGLGAGGALRAADFPAAVDGVLTLDLAAGVTNTYTAALPDATTLVKTGPGCAILGTASTAFKGNVDIREGTLTLKDRAAAGSNTKIAVTGDAATLHLNFPRPAGSGQSTVFFTGHDVTIQGRGVDGKGAFRYTATSDGLDDSMLESLTLADDALIAIPSRFGIQKAINLNGHALTRVVGGGEWVWFNAACTIDAGVISNVTGRITLQNGPTFTAPAETTLCMAGGELFFWETTPAFPCKLVLGGASLKTGSGSAVGRNVLAGPVTIERGTSFNAEKQIHRIELTGPVTTADGARISSVGSGTLHLNGPVSGTRKDLYVSGNGRLVCASNVTRTVAGFVLNGMGARCDLEGGVLDAAWVRLGNGSATRNALVQSGGTLQVSSDTYVGEGGGSYGAWMMSGGTATFNGEVNVAKWARSEGLVWQTGGTFVKGGWGCLNVGRGGRGFLGVFNGATNDSRAVRYGGNTRLVLGDMTNGVGTLAVSGTGSVVTTEALVMGRDDLVSTNVVAVTDGGTLKARRFYRSEGVDAAARNDVYVDGGIIMPTFWTGWNHISAGEAKFFARSPDHWTIGPRGMVVDTSEVDGVKEGETGQNPSDWPHALSDATGRGIASIDLPTDNEDFAAAVYQGPTFVDIEGPAGSHGAAAVAEFDPKTKTLTRIVVVSPGCDYDETTRVYLHSPEATGRYACTYTLTCTRAGGTLVKRGLYGLNLHGTNTYTGGTVVECGTLSMKGVKSFPANTPLTVKDGATFDNNKRELAVSVLGGTGGTVVNCPSVTVSEALEITAAELFAASGPLTVKASVTFADGVAVRVTDPENLPAHRHETSRPFLAAAGGFTGRIPTLDLADETGTRWTVYASGNSLRIGPVNGTLLILR